MGHIWVALLCYFVNVSHYVGYILWVILRGSRYENHIVWVINFVPTQLIWSNLSQNVLKSTKTHCVCMEEVTCLINYHFRTETYKSALRCILYVFNSRSFFFTKTAENANMWVIQAQKCKTALEYWKSLKWALGTLKCS